VKKLLLTIALAAAIIPGVASAAPATNGTNWLENCRSKYIEQKMACYTYARGIADGLTLAAEDDQSAFACIDQEVTAAQLVEIGLRFINKVPEYRHKPAGMLLALAFRDAWPCQIHGGGFKNAN
jgi:Rap1a immunity proteins